MGGGILRYPRRVLGAQFPMGEDEMAYSTSSARDGRRDEYLARFKEIIDGFDRDQRSALNDGWFPHPFKQSMSMGLKLNATLKGPPKPR